MQNRYAGDVGDFGKLGLLRCIASTGLFIGVNWYLVPDETHNDDGKHTGYIGDTKFRGCDDILLNKLKQIVDKRERTVLSLEAANLLPRTTYYNKVLVSPEQGGPQYRAKWHKNALDVLQDTDIVFLDPDNGLIVKSVGQMSKRSNKYVLPCELADYYLKGHSVIFYNHRSRQKEYEYLVRFRTLLLESPFVQSECVSIKFSRGTIRDYFFILQKEHKHAVEYAIKEMLNGPWAQHFSMLPS